jgi:hypothetical protein
LDLRHTLMEFFQEQIGDESEVRSRDSDRPLSIEDMGESCQVEADDLEAWRVANRLSPDDDPDEFREPSVNNFMQKSFDIWANDPFHFPGLNHTYAYLSSGGQDITYGCLYQNLTANYQDQVEGC